MSMNFLSAFVYFFDFVFVFVFVFAFGFACFYLLPASCLCFAAPTARRMTAQGNALGAAPHAKLPALKGRRDPAPFQGANRSVERRNPGRCPGLAYYGAFSA